MADTHVGSGFDDFLAEDGLLSECQAEAMKRVIAWQTGKQSSLASKAVYGS